MTTHLRRAARLLALPLTLAAAACGGDTDDRSALRDHELERRLNLALQPDSVPAFFQDTAVAPEPASEPAPEPAPEPQAASARPREEPSAEVPAPRPSPRRAAPQPRVVTATAAIGTSLGLALDQTLSTETNRVGDTFTATLQHAVTDASGETVIPAGAVIRGRLTQVEKSGHAGATGIIKVAFESVTFGGSSHALDATVVRANPQRQSRSNLQEQAGKVAAGAAAGAILGRVLGRDTRSTLRGAAVGAAAGTAIAMGTTDVDVVLPQGSEMVIRLDSPITVRRTVY